MTGAPTLRLLLDDGTGAFPYDITAYLRKKDGYELSRGRGDELADVTAGQLSSLTLNNTDGRFTPGSTLIASPSPIVADQQIRLVFGLVANTTFETSVAGYVGSNATLARSTAQAHSGLASMSITAVAAAAALAVDSGSGVGGVPVAGGVPYAVGVWARAATVARLVQLKVDWWDAAGTFISTSTGTAVADTTTGWTLIDEVFTSPATAAYARRQVVVASPAAGEVHYVDDFTFDLNRSTGYVQSWPVGWPGGKALSTVTITATDAQARAERRPLRPVLIEEAQQRTPFAHYALGEPDTATAAADSSGNRYPELVNSGTAPVVFGTATGLATDGLPSPTFTNTSALAATWPAPSGTGWSYVVFFNTAGPPGSLDTMIISSISKAVVANRSDLKIDATGSLTVLPSGSGGPYGTGLDNSAWHAFGISVDAAGNYTVMIDAATVGTGTNAALAGIPIGIQVGNPRGDPVSGLGDDVGFAGSLAHAILFNSVLTAASLNTIGQAGLTAFTGESGTARITRTAGYASLPLGTLDPSLTNVAFTDIAGTSAAAALRDVTAAEVGLLYVDGSGNLTFHNRNRAPLKTAPDIIIPAEALDVGTTFVTDMQGVFNYYEATAVGSGNGAQVARNTVSELGNGTAANPGHGRYPGSAQYLVQTDQEALDRANWIVTVHAEPQPRVGTLEIDGFAQTPDLQADLHALEPDAWVRITGLPAQTPGGTTADLMVQGFAERLSNTEWKISANVVAREMFRAWILGDATYGVLGSTTRLYV